MDPDEHPLQLRRTLLAQGVGDSDVRRAIKNQQLMAIRPGIYTEPTTYRELGPADRHRLAIRAAVEKTSTDAVISHESAAIMHGFTLWHDNVERVHFSIDRSAGGRRSPLRHVHASPFTADDITVIDGIRVTSAARTVADLARTMSFESAVCVGDSALRQGKTTKADAIDLLTDSSRIRGVDHGLRALRFLDGRSESVGESRSRIYLQRNGFPPPILQASIYDEHGVFIARPDFLWDGVIGEFDGRIKYTELLLPGQNASDVIAAEKAREDRLRALGWCVVRWTWDELRGRELARRLRTNFSIAATLPSPSDR